jgi:D-methionine transport system ATP-binding protein
MISLQHISKSYELNAKVFHALKDVSLTVACGEICGIFGASGAGKSTLLRTVNLLERPSAGRVLVDDVDLTALSASELKLQRQRIGMIFQHFNLLKSRTAFDNIALPLELLGKPRQQIKEEVSALLDLVKLDAHAHHYPQQLSGGQQQRVAIARALATRPQILLCDEPTSALDPHSTSSILNLLTEINRQLNVTILLITHEMDVIKQICHRAGVLDHGTLIEYGSVIDLFAKPKSDITRQLVQKALHLELPQHIKHRLRPEPAAGSACLVRFTFVGDDSDQPLIATLVQQHHVTVNIIQANIENIREATVGFTVCLISGDKAAIDNALQHVQSTSVIAEVLGYV